MTTRTHLAEKRTSNGPEITYSRGLKNWLEAEKLSILVSTYHNNKLLMIASDSTVSEQVFPRCMGLEVDETNLFVGMMTGIWRFRRSSSRFKASECWITGSVKVHDLGISTSEGPIFVNTLHNCLAKPLRRGFEPVWMPDFFDRMIPEDCCHLNGLAMVEGEPAYVTIVAPRSDPDGWREHRADGGCLIDVARNEVVLDGLSMPHSPRYYRDRIWLHNSGEGYFGYWDQKSGEFENVAFCPGFLRGLSFYRDHAVALISRSRQFVRTGLSIEEKLHEMSSLGECGICFINLDTGNVDFKLLFDDIKELYDLRILPGIEDPRLEIQ